MVWPRARYLVSPMEQLKVRKETDPCACQVKRLYEAPKVTTTLETHRGETLKKYKNVYLEFKEVFTQFGSGLW